MIQLRQYQAALDAVRRWKRAWIITHTRADGDAVASLVGARAVLRTAVQTVRAFVFEPVTRRYEFLVADDPLEEWKGQAQHPAEPPDGVVVVDTCARNQFEPFLPRLDELAVPLVVFDHHKSRDVEPSLGLIDESAAATALLINEWAEANGIILDHATNVALFAGLAADTGWFRFENADRRAYDVAGRLIERGVCPDELYNRLYCSDRTQRLALLARIYQTLELHAEGRIGVAYYTQEMLKSVGAGPGDLDELATEIGRIGTVICWALLSEQEDGRVRMNLRSKHTVDVAEIAGVFGGGGHARAAGARTSHPLDQVKGQILRHLARAVG